MATPAYFAYAAPGLAGYLLHWPLIGGQTVPRDAPESLNGILVLVEGGLQLSVGHVAR